VTALPYFTAARAAVRSSIVIEAPPGILMLRPRYASAHRASWSSALAFAASVSAS
jgi:hypothetical protein